MSRILATAGRLAAVEGEDGRPEEAGRLDLERARAAGVARYPSPAPDEGWRGRGVVELLDDLPVEENVDGLGALDQERQPERAPRAPVGDEARPVMRIDVAVDLEAGHARDHTQRPIKLP